MSSILNEAESLNGHGNLDNFEDIAKEAAPEVLAEEYEAPRASFDFSWLKARTGPGAIEDYINSPLNARGSRGIAQILRGVTGLVGDLDLAVVDIAIGAVNVVKEQRTPEGVANEAVNHAE